MENLVPTTAHPELAYDVTKVQLVAPDGTPTRFFGTQRVDTKQVLGCVSESYEILPNADLFGKAEEALMLRGFTDYKSTAYTSHGGARAFLRMDFVDQKAKERVRASKKLGGECGMSITLQNSFDGSLKAAFSVGILRLVCQNGMVGLRNEVDVARKHTSKLALEDFDKAFAEADVVFNRTFALFENLADVSITNTQGHHILNNLCHRHHLFSRKLGRQFAEIWETPTHDEDRHRNLFNLYNAVTQVTTHGIEREDSDKAVHIQSRVVDFLARAATRQDIIAQLTASPLDPKESLLVAA